MAGCCESSDDPSGSCATELDKDGLTMESDTHMPTAVWTHCLLHRYTLFTKKTPTNLQNLLSEATIIVNFIKSRPLGSRLFSSL
jgi:hypothetical protein